ncbi:MND1-interacting protein 1-like protein [Drosera capensis]
MGCTVRDKHIRATRRPRTAATSSLPKSLVESSIKLLDSLTSPDQSQSLSQSSNPNHSLSPPLSPSPYPNYEGCGGGWGYCTEDQLEEILLKHLDFVYTEVVSKIVALCYDEEVAVSAVLRTGYCCQGNAMDVLSNVLSNSLDWLNNREGDGEEGEEGGEEGVVFRDLRQLEEYSLAGMVCMLQQNRPQLSRGDAMWCLLMSDLHVGRASAIDIPMIPSVPPALPPPCSGCADCEATGGNSLSNGNGNGNGSGGSSYGGGGTMGLCKFHEGWGFGNGGSSEFVENELSGFFQYAEATLRKEADSSQKHGLTPEMKSLLKRNVAAFAAGLRANSKMQMQSHGYTSSDVSVKDVVVPKAALLPPPGDLSEGNPEENPVSKSLDAVNSVLNKFRDLDLNEGLDSVREDEKDEALLALMHQVKDLERQVKERKEWAQQKAMQAARKLSSDLTELKILRMEREETQRLKKGKQTLEDSTMKRLSEMENALRKASSQVDRANAAVRQLEVENAEIRAEMEASKLSASESVTTCLEVAKREKKCLKKLLAWEKQKTKLSEEIAAEKQKISDLQQQLVVINSAQKEAEVRCCAYPCLAQGAEPPSLMYKLSYFMAKWKQEVKAKEQAVTLVEEERRAKEAAETSNKRKLEALRSKIEIDFQRHKDDLQRLEQELSRLKSTVSSAEQTDPSHGSPVSNTKSARHQGDTIAQMLHHLEIEDNAPEKEASGGRECIVCMKEEVSVVFLPCAHQVMCASCGENYGKKGKAVCPCCRVPIEQRIRVFGASS